VFLNQIGVDTGLTHSGNLRWNDHPPWQEQMALLKILVSVVRFRPRPPDKSLC
jgi:hypothetical protein